MKMNEKQLEVYSILVNPIVSDKTVTKLQKHSGVIVSPQEYYSTPDEDMCDFAIGFYRILYGDNLLKNTELLDANNKIKNEDIAGDTMNSFNTIANMMDGIRWEAGNISIDPFLLYFKVHYHCLANFWLIPMKHGRRSAKTVGKIFNYDSPILYTHELMRMENEVAVKEFNKIHFLPEINKPEEIRELYERKDGKALLKLAWNYIETRARVIVSNEDMTKKLYDYFCEVNLLSEQ